MNENFNYADIDPVYIAMDVERIVRTRNLRLIPTAQNRRGGKIAYGEWAHVVGVFQTLMHLHVPKPEGNTILDVGCGTGIMAIASEPFVGNGGSYVGIDVSERDIEFCRSHYPADRFSFELLRAGNPHYAPERMQAQRLWEFENDQFDMITALSVWTHFSEADAIFYIRELGRVLKPGGRAIVTCFHLDESYFKSQALSRDELSRFHGTSRAKWVFCNPAYGSNLWRCPVWAEPPEKAIGMTDAAIARIVSESKLDLTIVYPGNWKEVPGAFFQDVLVLKKTDLIDCSSNPSSKLNTFKTTDAIKPE